MRKPLFSIAVFCVGMIAAILALAAQAQQLTVQLEDGQRKVLTRAEIEALPHIKIPTAIHGTPAAFEGVALQAVLEKAGVQFGESLRGARMASCLLVEAADCYRVVIALPEIDPAFTNKQIVLAFLKDGKPLDDKEGPYRIVIPEEKRPARWARQVTALRIVDVK
ncbi:MAG: molybdopterin-dependent oxidoreductase [Candidatus Sulfotelmatobacter sp.]